MHKHNQKPEIYIHLRVSLRNTYTSVGVRDQLNAKACITKRAILLSLAARTPKNTTQLQSPISQVLPITEKGNIYIYISLKRWEFHDK